MTSDAIRKSRGYFQARAERATTSREHLAVAYDRLRAALKHVGPALAEEAYEEAAGLLSSLTQRIESRRTS